MKALSTHTAANNPDSWRALLAFIESFPDERDWKEWKPAAAEFVRRGVEVGLDRRFRAGQSMYWLLFSTLDHHGLSGWDPHVTVFIRSREEIEISYSVAPLSGGGPPEVSYSLPFEEAFATFRRFLTHLWTATVPEGTGARGPQGGGSRVQRSGPDGASLNGTGVRACREF